MPSTYTTNGGIELIATGEQSGTWGDTTNDNLQIIDRLTNGVGSISLSGTTHTLTTSDGALSDGQYAVLVFGGTPSGTNTVTISPNTNQHVYIVKNSSGQSIVLTQGSGGNVTVADGDTKIVYCDGAGAGAAVVDITADFAMSNVAITGGSITGITDLAVADGGTGVSTVPTNGQLLIGNGSGYTVANLTAGTGASISNGAGTITISATGSGGTVTSVSGTGTKNGLTLTGTVTTTGDLTLGGTLAISDADWSGTDLSVANGGTGASSFTANNVLLGNGTSSFQTVAPGTTGNVLTSNGTTWESVAPAGGSVSYPQESKSADYTLVLADAGKQIFHPASDANVRTFTIPANSSVAFPIGAVVLFTADRGVTPVNVDINSDVLVTNKEFTGKVTVSPGNTLYCIKVKSTEWLGYFMYQSTVIDGPYYIAVGCNVTPYIVVYPFSFGGFGTKYSDPGTVPAGTGNGVAFSPAGDAIAVAHATTPYISAYPWNSSTGFGSKYSNPGTLPANAGVSVAFSPAGDAIAVAHLTSPFISAYPWDSSTGFGTKYSNPGTLPAGTGNGVAFSPAGDAIAVAHTTTPFIAAYPWDSSTGFGTKYSNPGTLPASTGNGVAFSPAGDAIAVAHATTPYISAYPWDSSTGFGSKYSNPGTLPANAGNGVTFSPAGDAIAVAHTTTPFISAYPWDSSTGFGTKYSDPGTLPTSTGNGVAFSAAGDAIAVAHIGSPFISAYPWDSSTGFGSKYSNPGTLPANAGVSVAFGTT